MFGQLPDSPPKTQRRKTFRNLIGLAAALCVGAAVTAVAPGSGSADPAGDFYTPPAQFDTARGAVIKTADMPVYLAQPSETGKWPLPAKLVMYTTRTQDDVPIAVTGTFIDATQPWQGTGPRPTVVIAPGTTGQGDQCALSRAFAVGIYATITPPTLSANQEALSALAWNSLGARVFVPDYIGMGTPGIHTYANRIEEAHAVIDAARAANILSGSGTDTPLAFWGYSQGGGASAAAAEMQPSYAPELNLKGTWAGAPTANLREILDRIEGSLIGGAVGYALNGFVDRYPNLKPELDSRVTPAGRALLDELATGCITDMIVQRPFLRTTAFTVDQRPLADHLKEIPEVDAVLRQQRTGSLTPGSPVLITSGINDDTVPYAQTRQLASDWCGQGAAVTFRTNELPPILSGATIPNHFGPELLDGFGTNGAVAYLVDRLNGVPVAGCTFD
ncbi:alpha/beta fold hydrolase [Nocardia huaxiensis]|uniref:Alpha/beta fold hydrolase n=1 Tax=Nocardia huaxiensis TaxID=2755382 RepID=A0A7D6VF51_9NOCA|nr:lipase family protein [Nocardia huaxiensis]QLY28696.1 alpha/beta fold hydrolase [Nocardia huaxiensis]